MHRLFVAIEIPEDIKEILVDMCDLGWDGANWQDCDQFHLTLKFIGEVECGKFDQIEKALNQINFEPFSLQLKGVGFFPPRQQPKVLWLGIERCAELEQLQNRVEQRLAKIGISREKRKFSPHITLARLKWASNEQVAAYLVEHSLFRSRPFMVNQFTLFSSHLSSSGAHYRREKVFPPTQEDDRMLFQLAEEYEFNSAQ